MPHSIRDVAAIHHPSGLLFETGEHHGVDLCPEALEVRDKLGRKRIYVPVDKYGMSMARPQDIWMDGRALTFEPQTHLPDEMPTEVRVTDPKGRSTVYRPRLGLDT